MVDISKIRVHETMVVQLDGADGEPLIEDGKRATVTVYGPGSKRFQDAQNTRNTAMLEYFRKGGKKKGYEHHALEAEFLASCTISIDGIEVGDLSGHELFRAVYLDPAVGYIAEQVNKAIGDWANFTKASDKT